MLKRNSFLLRFIVSFADLTLYATVLDTTNGKALEGAFVRYVVGGREEWEVMLNGFPTRPLMSISGQPHTRAERL